MERYEADEMVEELIEEKKGIKEILIDMKNISELMVDLAYSAILFNNDQLAEEVHELEEEMNKLRYQVETNAMLAARTPQQAIELQGILRVAGAAERISNAAKDLAEVVLRDIEPHPALKAALEEADEIVEKVTIRAKSPLIGKSVEEIMTDADLGVDIISIKRKGRWIFKVKDKQRLKHRDVIISTGFKERVEHFEELAEAGKKRSEDG